MQSVWSQGKSARKPLTLRHDHRSTTGDRCDVDRSLFAASLAPSKGTDKIVRRLGQPLTATAGATIGSAGFFTRARKKLSTRRAVSGCNRLKLDNACSR